MKPYSNDPNDGDKYARKAKKVQSRDDVIRARKKRVRQLSQLLVKSEIIQTS